MPNFLTTKEAAAAANCSELTIKRAIQSGQLRAYRPGRGYSIDPVDLENYVWYQYGALIRFSIW